MRYAALILLTIIAMSLAQAEPNKVTTSEKILLPTFYSLVAYDVAITANNLSLKDSRGDYIHKEGNPVVRNVAGRERAKIYALGAVGAVTVTIVCRKLPKASRLGFLIMANALEVWAISTWKQ